MRDFLTDLELGVCVATTKDRLEALELRLETIDGRIDTALGKPKRSSWVWRERNWFIPTVVTVMGGLFALAYHMLALEIDSHIQSGVGVGLAPVKDDIKRIDADIQRVKGILGVLQAQRYSNIPIADLKKHPKELKDIKNSLAEAPENTPGYWPAAFQIITLLSQTNFNAAIAGRGESVYDNITSTALGGLRISNQRALLKNTITGVVFEDSIVRFDPSVKLTNVLFINCAFIFPAGENPPKPLQEIGKTLLASDLSKVTLNSS
jgi:hypothetical protein